MALVTKEFAPKKPWKQRGLIAAAAALAVGVVVIAVAPDGEVDEAESVTSAETTVSVTHTATAPANTAKGSLVAQIPSATKSPADSDWLTAAPQGVSWQRVDGVPLPFSASDGPTSIEGAVAEGYTRTPQGAALAAIQIAMRMLFSPDFESVVREQTAVTSTERDQLISARSGQPIINADAVTAATLQPAAFKVGAYSDQDATVYYAYPSQDGVYRIARMSVTWQDDDWKYTGRMSPDAPELPATADISSFTAF